MMVEPYPHFAHGLGEHRPRLLHAHGKCPSERHCPLLRCEAGALAVSRLVRCLRFSAPMMYGGGQTASWVGSESTQKSRRGAPHGTAAVHHGADRLEAARLRRKATGVQTDAIGREDEH